MCVSKRYPHGLSASEQPGSGLLPLGTAPVPSMHGLVCPEVRCVRCGRIGVHEHNDPFGVRKFFDRKELGKLPENLGGVLCPNCGVGNNIPMESLEDLRLLLLIGAIILPVRVRVGDEPEHFCLSAETLLALCEAALLLGGMSPSSIRIHTGR